jgi:two-component system, NarL family, nitrate/nitrite response regulator NarL
MNKKIRVTILDDHPIIVRGYVDSLSSTAQIEVAAKINFGEQLEPTLKEHPTDVLLLDVNVPTSADNSNPYPILHSIPKLLQIYSELKILVISMHAERGLIRAVMDAGASGYILKDDHVAANDLGSVVMSVVAGGIYFSQLAHQLYAKHLSKDGMENLSPRQLEVLSLSTAYPDSSTAELAEKMSVSNSTVRNLLSASYIKLGVHNRTGAITKARQLGLITPNQPEAPK